MSDYNEAPEKDFLAMDTTGNMSDYLDSTGIGWLDSLMGWFAFSPPVTNGAAAVAGGIAGGALGGTDYIAQQAQQVKTDAASVLPTGSSLATYGIFAVVILVLILLIMGKVEAL